MSGTYIQSLEQREKEFGKGYKVLEEQEALPEKQV